MIEIWTRAVLACAAASFALYLAIAYARLLARATAALAKIPRARLAVFLAFALVATLSAQKQGGTNAPPNGASPPQMMMVLQPQDFPPPGFPGAGGVASVTSSDAARGFLLESVLTNDSHSYAMPTNATRYEKWWRRGAYEDVFRLDLGGMPFPLGRESLSSLWVYTWGMAGAHLGNASNRLVATGVPMSAVPGLSQFWSAASDESRILTWQDFALNRDTNTLVSAQLELYPDGGFIVRSNDVERVYRRVNPDDWDDDGIPNAEDDEPLVASEPAFGPHQELPSGANTNAYYWVDIVVSNASSLVTFTGDGASALPDPSFIALPGETNRVTLLIGKSYHVTSRMPIVCIGQSNVEIETWQDSSTSLSILWPVTIEAVGMRDGLSFAMTVTPSCLGGGFTWTNSCCSISSSGGVFTYSCNGTCHCTGCCALGCYTYEGFMLPASGGSCGCVAEGGPWSTDETDDDGPYVGGASAEFSKNAVIFEDGYWNKPGEWIGRHSTTTELHCVAHGGPNGGHVRFEVSAGAGKLERVSGRVLPVEQDVEAGKKLDFTVGYKGQLPSGEANDIVVTTTFTENVPNAEPVSSRAKVTSVKVELEAVYVAPENPSHYRHIYGVGERIKCRHQPTSVSAIWRVASYVAENVMTDGSECDKEITFAHLAENKPRVEVECCSVEYLPQFVLVEPTDVIAYSASWNGTCLPRGRAGGFGMKMNLYVYPMHVSFQGIDMVEVPCNDVVPPIGYYASTNFDGYLSHCSDAGAGWWHHVKAGNYWTEDEVGSGERHMPWSNGILVWNVPIAWNYRFDDTLSWPRNHYSSTCKKIREDSAFQQIYGIDGTGSVTIEKFDHVVERNTNDVVTVDYVIVHEGDHQ